MITTNIENGIEHVNCETADEFLDYLQIRKPHWLLEGRVWSPWIFRGQSNADWKLIPSAMRTKWFDSHKQDRREAIQRYVRLEFRATEHINREYLVELILQVTDEMRCVYDFIQYAIYVGHPIPDDKDSIESLPIFELILSEILRGIKLTDGSSVQNFDSLPTPTSIDFAIAQHHGIPTRLIDWSTYPLVAAYFCAEEAIKKLLECVDISPQNVRLSECECQQNLNDRNIAVWAIDRRITGFSDLRLHSHPKYKIEYLNAQSGVFLYDSRANSCFLTTGKWRSFDDIVREIKFTSPMLRKIMLSTHEVKRLLKLLALENITRAHLMPTYDNVTETIKIQRLVNQID